MKTHFLHLDIKSMYPWGNKGLSATRNIKNITCLSCLKNAIAFNNKCQFDLLKTINQINIETDKLNKQYIKMIIGD